MVLFKLTLADEPLLRFEASLVEDDDIADFLFKIFRKFTMEPGLAGPKFLEFVEIVLPVECNVLQADVGIRAYLPP